MRFPGLKPSYQLDVAAIERSELHLPSVRVRVELHLGDFHGLHEGVWLEVEALRTFQNELHVFEATRQGRATLVAMSPDEFQLTLEGYDTAGHVRLQIQLEQAHYESFGYCPTRLNGGFEMNSEYVQGLVAEVERLEGWKGDDAAEQGDEADER